MPVPEWDDSTKYHWKLHDGFKLRLWLQWLLWPPEDGTAGPARRAALIVLAFVVYVGALVLDLWLSAVGTFAVFAYVHDRYAPVRPGLEPKLFWAMVGALVYVPVALAWMAVQNRRAGKRPSKAWHRDMHLMMLVGLWVAAVAYLIASPRLPFRAGFTGPTESMRAWTSFYTDLAMNTALFGLPQWAFGRLTDITPASTAAKGAVLVFKGLLILLFINRVKKSLTALAAEPVTDFVGTPRELHDHLAGLPILSSNPHVMCVGVVDPVLDEGCRAEEWMRAYRARAAATDLQPARGGG